MTRLLFVLTLLSGLAMGQTYVRPSKGAAIAPWASAPPSPTVALCTGNTTSSGTWPNFPNFATGVGAANAVSTCSQPYDWSAFSGLRVSIYSGGAGTNNYGVACSDLIQQYTIPEVGSFLRLKVQWTPRFVKHIGVLTFTAPESTTITALDAPAVSGPYQPVQSLNGIYTFGPTCSDNDPYCSATNALSSTYNKAFEGCPVYISVVPMPFTTYPAVSLSGGSTSISNFGADTSFVSAMTSMAGGDTLALPTNVWPTSGYSSIVVGVGHGFGGSVSSAVNGLCVTQYVAYSPLLGASSPVADQQCFTVASQPYAVTVPVVGDNFKVTYVNGAAPANIQLNVLLKAFPQTGTVTPEGAMNVYVTNPSGGSGGGWVPDGGYIGSTNVCSTTASKNTTVGLASTAVPASGLAGRISIRVCNSTRNSGTPVITCTSDGTVPTAAASSAGDALGIGDCAIYPTASGIKCISDTASTYVTSEECK